MENIDELLKCAEKTCEHTACDGHTSPAIGLAAEVRRLREKLEEATTSGAQATNQWFQTLEKACQLGKSLTNKEKDIAALTAQLETTQSHLTIVLANYRECAKNYILEKESRQAWVNAAHDNAKRLIELQKCYHQEMVARGYDRKQFENHLVETKHLRAVLKDRERAIKDLSERLVAQIKGCVHADKMVQTVATANLKLKMDIEAQADVATLHKRIFYLESELKCVAGKQWYDTQEQHEHIKNLQQANLELVIERAQMRERMKTADQVKP